MTFASRTKFHVERPWGQMELFEALYATHRLGRGCVGINLIFEAPFVAEKSLLSAFLLADLCEASRDVRL